MHEVHVFKHLRLVFETNVGYPQHLKCVAFDVFVGYQGKQIKIHTVTVSPLAFSCSSPPLQF